MSNEMPKEEFEKSLARLESFAKSQLHHTPASSRTTSWAGSSEQDQNEHEDGIDDNGTDYNGVKKSLAAKMAKGGNLTAAEVAIYNGQDPRAYLADKVTKGQKLTAVEQWAIKGGMPFGMDEEEDMYAKKSSPMPSKANAPGENKDANSVPNTNAGDKEEEIEHDAKKSLEGAIAKSQTLQSGIEMSPFLYEQTRALGEALKGTEARVVKSVMAALSPIVARVATLEKSVAGFASEQQDFNKSLADGVIAIGHQVSGTAELADVAASQAARAPRSQLRSIAGGQGGVQAVSKSFGGGAGAEDISKSQVIEAMGEMVKSQSLSHLDLIKYETTGQMSPKTQQAVMAELTGTGR
jgi:hypothetical protein